MSIQELQKVKGIGPKYARMLSDAGITGLADLAASTPQQLHAAIQAKGGLAHYDDWIQQARDLTTTTGEAPAVGMTAAETQRQDDIQTDLQDLVLELNELAAQLKQISPHFQPPPYSPQKMKSVLSDNLDRFTPETVRGLQESLEGTSIDDFKDIETWKGVWFTLNYLIKLEATERTNALAGQLLKLPGISTLADLKDMLKDTPPEEFLNPETWKGVWFLVNYELHNAADGLKKRILRDSDEETDEDDWDDEDWDTWEA